MSVYSEETDEAIKISGVNASKVGSEKAADLWHNIAVKYTDTKEHCSFLWEYFTEEYSVCRPDSWTFTKQYLHGMPCYFIINCVTFVGCGGEKTAYYFEDGGTVADMYEETGQNIEFYITDENLSFLL